MLKILKILILISILIFSCKSQNDSSLIISKVNRAKACNILTRLRVTSDLEYIKYVSSFTDPDASEDENMQKFVPLLLITCMKEINDEYVEEIIDLKETSKINILSEENKQLLNVEKWENVLSANDQQKINEEIFKYSNEMKDLKQVQEYFDKDKKKSENNNNNNNYNINEKENDFHNDKDDSDSSQEFRNSNKNEYDLNIFGLDLKNINNNNKLFIGLSLLITLFSVLGVAIKKVIKSLPKSKQKSSNKKKAKSN